MVDIYILIAVIAALTGFLILGCWTFSRNQNQILILVEGVLMVHAEVVPPKGLTQEMIDSYPRVVVGESGRMLQQDDNTCPICLTEYLINDTLKILPECLHRYHADCLDEWLSRNATCPVCRIQASCSLTSDYS
ncbi:putative RING-H2 finger protein ATL69 [Silene latifolia]|uniref:putative RING-H2 finger protein ATL69 n=1 Tax=Silene latifolia TaxID=37657 RepID=UPI003D77B375